MKKGGQDVKVKKDTTQLEREIALIRSRLPMDNIFNRCIKGVDGGGTTVCANLGKAKSRQRIVTVLREIRRKSKESLNPI